MIKSESENKIENVCDLMYLDKMMGGKKNLIKGIIDAFLKQVPEELQSINDAITKTDYKIIKNVAHTMRSTVSIMGVSILAPLLKEIEGLGTSATDIEKIIELNQQLNLICRQVMEEIKREEHNYV